MIRLKRPLGQILGCIIVIEALLTVPLVGTPNDATKRDFRIKAIIVTGSQRFPDATIKSKLPYRVGDEFKVEDSNQALLNVYRLGHFRQVQLLTEKVQDGVNLHVVLTEKPLLKEVILVGNKHLSKKEISKKIDFEKIPAAEKEELKKLSRSIKNVYAEKGYHFPTVTLSTTQDKEYLTATFTIKEGARSIVKKVRFNGNKSFDGKRLRSLLFTREDWLLGPLDHSGNYHPLAVEQDKHTLEQFYQSTGFLHAQVTGADVTFDETKKEITVTFNIHEGDKYTISSIEVPGNDIYSEKELLASIPLRKGSLYSREGIKACIERLKTIWGDKGFIYADVEPTIEPDDEEKTVKLGFHSELGNKVQLNRINIFGNKKTRDKVIRRQFLLDEGALLTTTKLEASKQRIAGLGYFDRKEGVNWKINRIDEDLADIDVMLKEVKTGRAEFKITYGGSPTSMSSSNSGVSTELQLTERNIFGKGLMGHLNARIGQDERAFSGGFTQPWLFDKPIRVGASGNYSQSSYQELRKVENTIKERRAGGLCHLGFVAERLGFVSVDFQLGLDKLEYYSKSRSGQSNIAPQASIVGDDTVKSEYQQILDDRFKSATFPYIELAVGKDTRNHHTHITRGYKWNASARMGIPSIDKVFGFYHLELDGHWYTPLINESDLVLHIHGHLGQVGNFKNYSIPFRELYHVGGQASVRGWDFGQIGPQWYHPDLLEDEGWQGESIGAQNAAFMNVELIFPFTEDMSIKGVVFYDGGSGWQTPHQSRISPDHLKNNSFDYRHSIGVGVRLLNPQPMRVDWGFKLDKRPGESAGEVSFSSYYDF